MVKKEKQKAQEKRQKGKGGTLKLNKETVKELPDSQAEKARGGIRPRTGILCTVDCVPPTIIKI